MTHHPRKRFGQNFLIDAHVIAEIIAALNPKPNEHIVEIGPGHGALTRLLVTSGAKLDAIEIDRDLARHLQETFRERNFTLHCADILKFPLQQLINKPKAHKLRIIGNLPYNISSPLLFKLFSELDLIQDMYFMFQKEVALRLIAKPNTKDYGRMSVMAQYYCDMHILFNVPPTAFMPPPKVDSCVVQFIPHPQPQVLIANHNLFQDIVTHAFCHRRKTITNALKDFITEQELSNLQLNPKLRAENLSLLDYTNIANYLSRD